MAPTTKPTSKALVRGTFPTNVRDSIAWQPAPPRSKTVAVKASPAFIRAIADKGALRPFLDRAGTLSSRATNMMDGRHQPIVVAVVRDKDGRPARGIVARLLQDGELRDQTRTDKRGVAMLLFPRPATGHGGMGATTTKGRVEVLIPDDDNQTRDITIPAHKQHVVTEFLLERVPGIEVPVMATENGEATAMKALMAPSVPLIDNPLDRLPADFSTELCEDLTKLLGAPEDPILGLGSETSDFRKRRIPIVKRMTVARLGALDPTHKSPPKRYLVRLRQEWNFVGYSLGEVVDVDALSPGAIVDETVRSVQRATSNLAETVSDSATRIGESVTSELHQAASVDIATDIATKVRTQAAAGGFFLGLPFLGIGGVGATAGVSTTTAVRSRTDTSLDVNASLHMAKSILNTASQTVQSTRRDLQRITSTALSQVSPLLSRVTNLLKWTLYENYMVCTHVEDVLEVQDVTIADLSEPDQNGLLFTDEQIVDLRRIFSPGLLEPRLRGHFDALAAAVDARRGALLPITAVHVTFDATVGMGGATATARIGTDETTVRLRPGSSRVTQVIRLSNPILAQDLPNMSVDLTLGPDFTFPIGGITIPNNAQIARVELGFQSASGFIRRQSVPMGSDLTTDAAHRTDHADIDLNAPPPAIFTDADPLVVHINKNRTYYFGLLAQAALLEPSLRNDYSHFDAFGPDHELWRLPIVGFEGNRALVVQDANEALKEVQELLADPGSATLIQLAAPGAYGEALQGLLKLATDIEQLHPQLLPAPAPVMPPLAVVDLTGKTIPLPVGGTSGSGTTVPVGTGGTSGLPVTLPP